MAVNPLQLDSACMWLLGLAAAVALAGAVLDGKAVTPDGAARAIAGASSPNATSRHKGGVTPAGALACRT
jgi:hypothetical protein